MKLFTLTTDFGNSEYAAALKGVILSEIPDAVIIDITHEITPQDITSAAYVLKSCYHCFPPGTFHIAVVDPGVGTDRNICVMSTPDYYFVGPDNGIFSYIPEQDRPFFFKVSDLTGILPDSVSNTFHGRDIFVPVAVAMARGLKVEEFCTEYPDFVKLKPQLKIEEDSLTASILHIDRFGNLITAIEKRHTENRRIAKITINSTVSIDRICDFYDEAPDNSPVALWGSSDHLEICVKRGNAARIFDNPRSVTVYLEFSL